MSLELITANHAAGIAATMSGRANRSARGFGSGVYPITPQTECIELLCRQEIDKGSVVRVESEHSAMAVCMGFSFAGARSFTASSSNGIAYMVENVISAAMMRLPIVMMAVNRTLGPPWNIWVDHADTLMLRDFGWIQFYCEDNQEVFDTMLLAFRLAEDRRVMLPALVCQDAFVLSHTAMLTDLADQTLVDTFLPPLDLPHRIDTRARSVGGLDFPRETEAHRRQHAEAMDRVPAVYREVQDEFESCFGRRPADAVVPYRTEDAEVLIVSMGTTAAAVKVCVDRAREKGIRVGAVRVRMFRPFPETELRACFEGVEKIAILDRDLAPGMGGVLWSEARALADPEAIVTGTMLGLGGGDILPEHIDTVLSEALAATATPAPKIMEVC